jgi:hypothetical protein
VLPGGVGVTLRRFNHKAAPFASVQQSPPAWLHARNRRALAYGDTFVHAIQRTDIETGGYPADCMINRALQTSRMNCAPTP